MPCLFALLKNNKAENITEDEFWVKLAELINEIIPKTIPENNFKDYLPIIKEKLLESNFLKLQFTSSSHSIEKRKFK